MPPLHSNLSNSHHMSVLFLLSWFGSPVSYWPNLRGLTATTAHHGNALSSHKGYFWSFLILGSWLWVQHRNTTNFHISGSLVVFWVLKQLCSCPESSKSQPYDTGLCPCHSIPYSARSKPSYGTNLEQVPHSIHPSTPSFTSSFLVQTRPFLFQVLSH